MAVIVIEIPMLPPKQASPNWRGHWAVKYRAMRNYKEVTYLMAKASLRGRDFQSLDRAIIRPTFVVPNRRYIMDPDNALASLKSAIDGLQAARIIANDRNVVILPVTYRIDTTTESKIILEIEATISNDQS